MEFILAATSGPKGNGRLVMDNRDWCPYSSPVLAALPAGKLQPQAV